MAGPWEKYAQADGPWSKYAAPKPEDDSKEVADWFTTQTDPAIAQAVAGCGVKTQHCADMAAAVAFCRTEALSGDAVLLSPACASAMQVCEPTKPAPPVTRII